MLRANKGVSCRIPIPFVNPNHLFILPPFVVNSSVFLPRCIKIAGSYMMKCSLPQPQWFIEQPLHLGLHIM